MFDQIVEPLGFTAGMHFAYFVYSTRTIRILSPAQHRKPEFLAIETEVEWRAEIDGLPFKQKGVILDPIYRMGEHTGEYRIDWLALGGLLMDMCRKKGDYDPNVGRGRSIWLDPQGDVLFNTGYEKVTFVDGIVDRYKLHKIAFSSDSDPFRYLSAKPHAFPPADEPASAGEVIELLTAFSRFDWLRPEIDPKLLVGWISCAVIFNLLDFRPHLAVTAVRGAGKSTLIRYVVELLGRDTNCLHVKADATTEPGLRQTLAFDAMPVVADEFETTGTHARDILLLLRLASNPTSGRILKGSADGKSPLSYTPRTCALVSGITINFESPADATRFAVIEIVKRAHNEEERGALKSAFENLEAQTGARLARRMIDQMGVFQTNLSRFRSAILERGSDDRRADLYGTLLAGYWTACNDDPVSIGQAFIEIEHLEFAQDDDQDERDCLNHLLGQRVNQREATIFELISIVAGFGPKLPPTDGIPSEGEANAARALEQLGIKMQNDHLVVANKGPGINSVYTNTRWRNGAHAKRLKRLGGNNDDNKAHKFLGITSKVTALPLKLVFPNGM